MKHKKKSNDPSRKSSKRGSTPKTKSIGDRFIERRMPKHKADKIAGRNRGTRLA